MSYESPTNPPENDRQGDVGKVAPFGLPRVPLHRFSFQSPRVGWGFLDTFHGLTCYLMLWDGAVHDDDWFAKNRDAIVWKYDDWEGPHYGDAVVLHEIQLKPGIRPEDRSGSEAEAVRQAILHLRKPIPLEKSVTTWQSVQYREHFDAGMSYCYQALFLQPEGDHDLLRSACLLRSVEDRFNPPESIRLDLLDLEGYGDCCVEVSVPRQAFRKAYHNAIFGRSVPTSSGLLDWWHRAMTVFKKRGPAE